MALPVLVPMAPPDDPSWSSGWLVAGLPGGDDGDGGEGTPGVTGMLWGLLPMAVPGELAWWDGRVVVTGGDVGDSQLTGVLVGRLRLLPWAIPIPQPAPRDAFVWALGARNVLELRDVVDTGTDDAIAGATVVATVLDSAGGAVAGIAALTLHAIDGTPGAYRWSGARALVRDTLYRLRVTITLGPDVLVLERALVVRPYREAE